MEIILYTVIVAIAAYATFVVSTVIRARKYGAVYSRDQSIKLLSMVSKGYISCTLANVYYIDMKYLMSIERAGNIVNVILSKIDYPYVLSEVKSEIHRENDSNHIYGFLDPEKALAMAASILDKNSDAYRVRLR